MPSTLRSRVLFRGSAVLIADVRCRPAHAGCGDEESVRAPSVAFVRKGVFVKHVGRRRLLADANQMVFFNPDHPYRVSHPVAGGDDCTSFSFRPGIVHEALAGAGGVGGGHPRTFPADHALDEPRAVLMQQALRRLLRSGGTDAVEIEELCMHLLRILVGVLRERTTSPRGPRRDATRGIHRRAVDGVRMILDSRFADRLTLGGIARDVGCSPYHLARIFRREAGLTIHRYLNRRRLRAGLDRLVDGAEALTGIALDVGFSSHAHFTEAFRREFGLPPSAFRLDPTTAALRQLSKNLKADGPPASVSSH